MCWLGICITVKMVNGQSDIFAYVSLQQGFIWQGLSYSPTNILLVSFGILFVILKWFYKINIRHSALRLFLPEFFEQVIRFWQVLSV